MPWSAVEQALDNAHSIAFDGCHKIYVHMTPDDTETSRTMGYTPLLVSRLLGDTPRLVTDKTEALAQLQEWWRQSCGLRFVQSITNFSFDDLIAQGEEVADGD